LDGIRRFKMKLKLAFTKIRNGRDGKNFYRGFARMSADLFVLCLATLSATEIEFTPKFLTNQGEAVFA
jgi:hypothetical protein